MFPINVALAVLIYFNPGHALTDEVQLPTGRIRGHILETTNGNQYYAFQEIPYASPPIGDLRFKEPVAPKSWTGILNTVTSRKVCHQIGNDIPTVNITETEDCLYINVYTPFDPQAPTTNLLPVLVWIHGGGFIYGYGVFQEIGPQYFIDYGVVVVSFNYRLGPFGFLTTEDDVIPGNIGLKDQNFALQWVKNNINLFGGDPTKITIAGESAGGVSVGLQLISKKSAGLFRAAIIQSGTAISSFAHQPFARHYAFELGNALNHRTDNSTDLLAFLQNASAESIKSVNIPVPYEYQIGIGSDLFWLPVIEPANYPGAFLSAPMHEDIRIGNINRVPIIIGFTSEEGIAFMFPIPDIPKNVVNKSVTYDNNLSGLINNKFNISQEDKEKAGAELRNIYTDTTFLDKYGSIVRLLSDEQMSTPASRHAELQSSYTDVFVYQFSHKGILGGYNTTIDGEDVDTVGHAEDIKYLWSGYVWNNEDISKFPVSDILTHNRLLKLWTNFVKFLNPTPDTDGLLQNIKWPKATPNNLTYLNINTTLEVKTDPKKYKQWKTVIDKYTSGPLITY